MANPDYTAQDVPTWAANLDSMNSLKAIGNIKNPLLHLPLLNSLAFAKGVGSLTFARASVATYIDRYGVLQSAAIDEPRFEANGLLIEGASENLLPESDDFTLGAWALTGTMNRTGGQADPAGGTDAVLLEDTDVAGDQAYIQDTAAIANDSLTRTASIFLQPGSAPLTTFAQFLSGGTLVSLFAVIDWSAKTITSGTLEGPFSNGYYRAKVPITNNSSGNTTWQVRIYPAGAAATATGTVTAFRAQAEELPFATSPIETTGAPVTRSADTLNLTIAGNIGLQADAGTILCDVDVLGFIGGSTLQAAFTVRGETSRRIFAANGFAANVPTVNWGPSDINGDVLTIGVTSRLGAVHDGAGESSIWQDGIEKSSVSGEDVSDSLGTDIDIGFFSASSHLFGHITNIRIYNRALSDREMAVA